MINTYISSAAHPLTNEVYSVGDEVCVYQGRFGHSNNMKIVSMWHLNDVDGTIGISPNKECKDITYLSAVKYKIPPPPVKFERFGKRNNK